MLDLPPLISLSELKVREYQYEAELKGMRGTITKRWGSLDTATM